MKFFYLKLSLKPLKIMSICLWHMLMTSMGGQRAVCGSQVSHANTCILEIQCMPHM